MGKHVCVELALRLPVLPFVLVGPVQHLHHSGDLGDDALLGGELVEEVLEEGGAVLGIAALLLSGVSLKLNAKVVWEEVLGSEHPSLGGPTVALSSCLSCSSHQILLIIMTLFKMIRGYFYT